MPLQDEPEEGNGDGKQPFAHQDVVHGDAFDDNHKTSGFRMRAQRQLGIKPYETAHDLMHKLRDAMGQREGLYKLDDGVELDEMFFDVATEGGRDYGRARLTLRPQQDIRFTRVLF